MEGDYIIVLVYLDHSVPIYLSELFNFKTLFVYIYIYIYISINMSQFAVENHRFIEIPCLLVFV